MLLLKLKLGACEGVDFAVQARTFAQGARPALALQRVAVSTEEALAYVYLDIAEGASSMGHTQDAIGAADSVARAFATAHAWCASAEGAWLDRVFDVPGASAGEAARFHYVVETDADDGWFDEIARWYDEEHMPGLAAVPGCIRAQRFLNRSGRGPASFACYDLVAAGTMGSPAWLAVRYTPWGDRTRPHFTNTRRTMFRVA